MIATDHLILTPARCQSSLHRSHFPEVATRDALEDYDLDHENALAQVGCAAVLGRALLSLIYPPHCILCSQLIEATTLSVESATSRCEGMRRCEGICQSCVATILEQSEDRCPRCTAPMSIGRSGESASDVVGARFGDGVRAPAGAGGSGRADARAGADARDGAQAIAGAAGCLTCASWPLDGSFHRAVALGAFDGPLREAVHALKFNGSRRIGRQLGRWIGLTCPHICVHIQS